MQPTAKLSLFLLSLSVASTWVAAENEAAGTTRNGDIWKETQLKFSPQTFLEQFPSPDVLTERWVSSQETKQADVNEEEAKKNPDLFKYKGEWAIEEPHVLVGSDISDYGLVLKTAASHHAISSVFPKSIQFKGQKQITIQYEAKFQVDLECGGAYMKVLEYDEKFNSKKFTDTTPFSIMFGPDRCGGNNRVHFIFRFKNPKSGEILEHKLKNPPLVDTTSKKTHLYTLKIFPTESKFELLIDNKSDRKGSLFEDFEPPVIPAAEIDDPEDKKPSDWVDEAKIPDPDAKKPEDWDEAAPFEIVDEDAKRPDDWLPNERELIPDPEAAKPEDWDDDDDGEWIAPEVPNPKCKNVSGCGEWKKPLKKNPAYKGRWSPPLINNPAYKGVWAPSKISNPDFFEEKQLGEKLLTLGGIGFELWSMQADILFDNILISNETADVVEKFTTETFIPKLNKEADLSKASDPPKPSTFSASSVLDNMKPISEQFTLDSLHQLFTTVHLYPVEVLQQLPFLAGSLLLVFLLIPLRLFIGLFKIKKNAATFSPKKGSTKASKIVDVSDDDDQVATGTSQSSSPTSKLKQRKPKPTLEDDDETVAESQEGDEADD